MTKLFIVLCFHTILIQVSYSQIYTYPGQGVPDGLMLNNAVNGLPGVPFGNGISGGYYGVVGGFPMNSVSAVSGGLTASGVNNIGGINPALGLPLGNAISGVNAFGNAISGVNTFGNAISGVNAFGNPLASVNSIPDFGPSYSSGPFIVNSYSPIASTGLSIVSENTIEGALNVFGQLPFLSVVAFEGMLPSAGSGVATCGCGSGSIGIINEGLPNIINNGNYGNFVSSG